MRTRTRVLAMLALCAACVLGAALPAAADTTGITGHGGATLTWGGANWHIAGVAFDLDGCSAQGAPADCGSALVQMTTTSNTATMPAAAVVTTVDSGQITNAAHGRLVYSAGTLSDHQAHGFDNEISDGPDTTPGQSTQSFWIPLSGGPTANSWGGLYCVGIYQQVNNISNGADLAASEDPAPCNSTSDDPDLDGVPRDTDIGFAGVPATGGTVDHEDGQQADGTIDIGACIAAKNANAGGVSIASLVYPIQCAFLWAFTPPTNYLTTETAGLNEQWDNTQLGKVLDKADIYSIDPDTSCEGIPIDWSFLHIPGTASLPTTHGIGYACSGPMATWAGVSTIFGIAGATIGLAFAMVRMFSGFIHAPNPEGGDRWEDTRLF